MGLNPIRWKIRNIFYLILALFIFYIFFIYKKKYHVNFEGTIQNSNPIHVWEYVADFSNMKKLNPTIEEFNVIAESGNYDHWKYSVEYAERLSHVPFIRNIAQADYVVRQDNNGYLITSKHRTCFFSNFGCLESISQFRVDRDGANDIKCIETVQYECPIIFSELCYREVMYQREEIMKRLQLEFSVAKATNE
ncbi:uncharacterized protein LOC143362786 [Halictus rubicundus]|uniref:uncharacterized protein LOC143362786 n=1 Tax=Halictus rubicundus TaxID=77578 RepID=UPI004035DCE4